MGLPLVYSKGLSGGVEGRSDQKLEMNTELEPIEVVASNHLCLPRTKRLNREVSDDSNLQRTFKSILQRQL